MANDGDPHTEAVEPVREEEWSWACCAEVPQRLARAGGSLLYRNGVSGVARDKKPI